MRTLLQLLSGVDDLDPDGVLHAAPPWSGDSDASCLSPDDEDVPPGLTYLLEVDLVQEVGAVWSSWRDGRAPTPDELTVAVIHYAEHDAYLPRQAGEESS